jgi:hypothetical protein
MKITAKSYTYSKLTVRAIKSIRRATEKKFRTDMKRATQDAPHNSDGYVEVDRLRSY